ncbi:MAG: ferric reductase-like transmembrane domain-containing protein [Candidatus Gracilibacteria bacterium]|nr:ferric reductase-like transmembrane domain-containing protein [Candidatus Gracilibacteria bacterium]
MMSALINSLNTYTQTPLANKMFKWMHPVMIYGSFLLPFAFLATGEYKDFGSLAWAALIVIMVIRPLVDLFPKIILFKKVLAMRRGIGIVSGMAALTHGIGFFYLYPSEIGANYLWSPNQFFLYGIIGLVFSTLLLITSNNISVRFLGKKWKWLQRGVYGMFYLVCVHIALIGGRYGIDYTPIVLGIAVFVLRVFAWNKKRSAK